MDALDLWRAELEAGFQAQRSDSPSTWRFDALWRSACAVAFAREAEMLGLPGTAASWRRQSAQIIVHAAKEADSHRKLTANSAPVADV